MASGSGATPLFGAFNETRAAPHEPAILAPQEYGDSKLLEVAGVAVHYFTGED